MRLLCRGLMHCNGSAALFLLLRWAQSNELSFGVIGAINLAIALALHTQLLRKRMRPH
jgi:hypothetical protein